MAAEHRDVPLFSMHGICLAGRSGTLRLRDLTVDLPDHVVSVIVGPSGSGKSSLLRLCNRLEAPDRGTIEFRGTDLAELDPHGLRRQVGMLFQRPVTFPGTGRDNLLEAAPAATDDQLEAWLEQAGLDRTFLDRVADELSGGQAQRLCLARALATEPDVLLADEATSALDRSATRTIESLVGDLAGAGTPVVWVTHDLHQARRLADHLVVVEEGRVGYAGSVTEETAASIDAAFERIDRNDEDESES